MINLADIGSLERISDIHQASMSQVSEKLSERISAHVHDEMSQKSSLVHSERQKPSADDLTDTQIG